MNRWSETFENLRNNWNELKKLAEEITQPDESVAEEVLHFRKVITYVDTLIEATDPELVPINTWANFNNQIPNCKNILNSYNNTQDLNHIQSANTYLDEMLSTISPYVASGKKSVQAAAKAYRSYSANVSQYIEKLKSETQSAIDEIKNNEEESTTIYKKIEESGQDIQKLYQDLFEENEEEESKENKINNMFNEILNYLQQLTVGDGEEIAIHSTN